jgi:TrkA family protein/RyR domain-containing protein
VLRRGEVTSRRTHWRAVWRGKRWLIIGVSAGAAFVLGYVGFRQSTDDDVLSAIYHSLQLFALGGEDVPDPSVSLTVARFLAPAIAAFAAIQALYLLLRQEMQLLGIRFLVRDHVIVAGLGSVGFRLALAFDAAGYRVIAIDRDPGNPALASCRERGIAAFAGDAADPAFLERARLPYAKHLIVTCGDDVASLDVTHAATTLTESARRDQTVLVHLEDLELWRMLQAQMLASPPRAGFRIEFFNVLDAAGRRLIERHPPSSADDDWHVLFVGLDGVGEFALIQVVRRWQGPGLRISIAGPEADGQLAGLLERHPELSDACTLEADAVELSSARFRRGELANDPGLPTLDAVYVCLDQPTDALAAALVLRSRPETRAVPLVVTLWDRRTTVAELIRRGGGQLQGVDEFAVLDETLVADVGVLGTSEVIARLRHEAYLEWERKRGSTPEMNPSMVPWDELPESLKASNRAFAQGVGQKLAASGCALVPAAVVKVDEVPKVFSDGEVEELARGEHDRWMNDLVADGWRFGAGPKDPSAKTHPLLKPWEELDEVARERDRDSIRDLPGLLARAGFEVFRTGDRASELLPEAAPEPAQGVPTSAA